MSFVNVQEHDFDLICPRCSDSPDEELVMEALGKAYENNPEAPDLNMTVPLLRSCSAFQLAGKYLAGLWTVQPAILWSSMRTGRL